MDVSILISSVASMHFAKGSIDLLELKEASESISLRWEQDFAVINFVVISEIITSKEIYPIDRMVKTKNDPPPIVAYYL